MADNIPTTVIRNIPPFVKVPNGNDGSTFLLPDNILQYGDLYLAQEVPSRDPIEQETGDYIDL